MAGFGLFSVKVGTLKSVYTTVNLTGNLLRLDQGKAVICKTTWGKVKVSACHEHYDGVYVRVYACVERVGKNCVVEKVAVNCSLLLSISYDIFAFLRKLLFITFLTESVYCSVCTVVRVVSLVTGILERKETDK